MRIRENGRPDIGPLTEFEQFKKEIIPGYVIQEQLGKGATGVVFSALEKKSGQNVALKIFYLHYSKNRDFVRRLTREAEMITRLRHPNIVTGYDYGSHEGYYYTVMEYVEGRPLSDILKKSGALDERYAAEIILKIANALSAACQERIIHRDIKPSNIILTKDDVVKLTDFGLAKEEVDTSLTRQGAMLGTPLYVSPEQARGEYNLDIRSDIYSLGITFYALVVGKPPFTGLNTSLLLTKKITDEIPSPCFRNPSLTKEVCAIILKMCRRERKSRYNSPQELINALESYLAGEFQVDATVVKTPSPEPTIPKQELKEIINREIKDASLLELLKNEKIDIRSRVLEEGDILFYEEDASRETYILLSGKVEILKAGRRVAMISENGAFIGEMSTLLNDNRTATVRSCSRSILLEIPEETFRDFIKAAPETAMKLARSLASRLQKTTNNLKDAQNRLATIKEHYWFIRDELDGV